MSFLVLKKISAWITATLAVIIVDSGGALPGGVALLTFVLVFFVLYKYLPPAIEWMLGWFGRNVLGLTDEDFCGVKATTGHMSSMWSYENSPKGKRDARRRAEEEKAQQAGDEA
ncbi:hypothetical protein K1X12_15940 [Hyphomonas sp. WL0036]|uniref:hypothetical protein n=1 Tax=Hyphomonas sediminis TaxID=2866160 RepID=UPI001C7E98DC|nr:hypothetical protein [Hyphomonas sediminis]MBY9068393.1 hypothetical protein [Hyphomonas sediminis]